MSQIAVLENMVSVLNKDLITVKQELRDTQKELSSILSEFQGAISSLAMMASTGIKGLDARIGRLERVVADAEDSSFLPKEVSDFVQVAGGTHASGTAE